MSDYTWLFFFWGFLFSLGVLEFKLSDHNIEPKRSARWPVNIGFGLVNGAVVSLLPIGTVLAAAWAAANDTGLLTALSTPFWLLVIMTILCRSLCQYVFHWLVHRVPLLWSVHRVHHCDTVLDGSTGLRFHPLELLASLALIVPLTLVLGLDPSTLAIYETAEILIGIATHTSIRLPDAVEKSLRVLFITPGLHRLHHSDDLSEANSNFGTVFSFWDRLFGTYLATPKRNYSLFQCGVKGVDEKQANDFGWLFISPLAGPSNQRRSTAQPVGGRPRNAKLG